MSKQRLLKREQEKNGKFLNALLQKFNVEIPDNIATAPMLKVYPKLLELREKLHREWHYYAWKNNSNPKRVGELELDMFMKFSYMLIVNFILEYYHNCEKPNSDMILQFYRQGLSFEDCATKIIADEHFRVS